jgi:glycosyltransferase involved in cell wall biosynthesis
MMDRPALPVNAAAARGPLRIAICLQELKALQDMIRGERVADGTYIVQGYIAMGLGARGHRLTFVAPRDLQETELASDLAPPAAVRRTWSASRWFGLTAKTAWRAQRLLGLPYLSVFANYRLLDACLRCLPGHDVVYERNGLYSAGVAMACRRLRLPYVVFFEADQILEHGYLGQPIRGLLKWRAGRLLRYNLAAADAVICVSEPARAHLIEAWGPDPDKVVVIPNGVDVARFRPDPDARAAVREQLGAGDAPMIAFVGSFFEWHDLGTLIDAFALLRAAHPETRLVLAGDGRQRQAMERRASDLGVDRAVHFTGLLPHGDVPRLLGAADVAVAPYPALKDPLWLSPLKLFEYMASGCAVVASDAGQVGQVIQDGRNGLLVRPGDAASLARALEQVVRDSALRVRLGRQAREDAVQHHSWSRYIDRLESLFSAVMARGRPSGAQPAP